MKIINKDGMIFARHWFKWYELIKPGKFQALIFNSKGYALGRYKLQYEELPKILKKPLK